MALFILIELIKNRRSVFPERFAAGKKVDDSSIQKIILHATWVTTILNKTDQ